MMKITKIVLLAVVLLGTTVSAFADRGIGKKAKGKVSLNIVTSGTLRNSLAMNYKSGLTYRGSILVKKQVTSNNLLSHNIVTFQKGNTIYILPYKQRLIVPEIKQGYTGAKIAIPIH